ncbi:MAG: hypothetical protein GX952_02885 [Firmicutes bacterium]|nr:hypothetical protein [Bacillota bacterium]
MGTPAKWSLQCVDAGTQYCPCYLAESGHCFVCSLLAGAEFCDCRWSGDCSYMNFRHKNRVPAGREETVVEVKVQLLRPDLIDIRFRVGAEAAMHYSQPGAFLFIRPLSAPSSAAVPLSIVDVINDEIWLVAKCVGPKSKLLSSLARKAVVKGPFFSALSSSHLIKISRNQRVVLAAGGVGQSAIILAAKTLQRGGNIMKACIAPGAAGMIYTAAGLENCGAEVVEVASMRESGLDLIGEWLIHFEPTLVVCAGPDIFKDALWQLAAGRGLDLVHSQNINICCGEGLCGSCLSADFEQGRVPLCKAQYRIYEGRR